MKEAATRDPSVAPTFREYDYVLMAFASVADRHPDLIADARALFHEMGAAGVPPSDVTYAATIKAASRDARREAWEECRDLLRQAADGPGATRQALTGVFTAMAGSLGASARDLAVATVAVELLAHF